VLALYVVGRARSLELQVSHSHGLAAVGSFSNTVAAVGMPCEVKLIGESG